jgi:hypothetical protein
VILRLLPFGSCDLQAILPRPGSTLSELGLILFWSTLLDYFTYIKSRETHCYGKSSFRFYLSSGDVLEAMVSNTVFAISLLSMLLVYILKSIFSKARKPPLPPGPKGLPLVGNILDMPSEKDWFTFAKWGETYGMF